MNTRFFASSFTACVALALAGAAFAQQAAVDVQDAWVRATVPGKPGTGAFMKLTAKEDARLVGAASPVAGVAEVHEMKLEGDVMKMRPLANGLNLPARQTIELKPGGYHLMLMDLKQTLADGATVPLTLSFRDAQGTASTLTLQIPVKTHAPGGDGKGAQGHSRPH